MSFTREFVPVTGKSLKSDWACAGFKNGRPVAFFCGFCGHDFEMGDDYRMCFTNDIPGTEGNPLTCKSCWDAAGGYEGLRNKWKEKWRAYREDFKWWANR